jgi:hypothetical protein
MLGQEYANCLFPFSVRRLRILRALEGWKTRARSGVSFFGNAFIRRDWQKLYYSDLFAY